MVWGGIRVFLYDMDRSVFLKVELMRFVVVRYW